MRIHSFKGMYIAVDFDGTCVTHNFPEVGYDIGAVPALKALVESGNHIILNTMRSHPCSIQENPAIAKLGLVPTDKDTLQEAIDWFDKNGIPLCGVNRNPTQALWTTSPKVYAHLYIDDAALGCPLIHNEDERPYVDWKKVMLYMVEEGIVADEAYSKYLNETLKENEL